MATENESAPAHARVRTLPAHLDRRSRLRRWAARGSLNVILLTAGIACSDDSPPGDTTPTTGGTGGTGALQATGGGPFHHGGFGGFGGDPGGPGGMGGMAGAETGGSPGSGSQPPSGGSGGDDTGGSGGTGSAETGGTGGSETGGSGGQPSGGDGGTGGMDTGGTGGMTGGTGGMETGGTGGMSTGGGSSEIDVWYGLNQTFGPATPQRHLNVVGKVTTDVTSLSYRLNGGGIRPLPLGNNSNRLAKRGDFNVELDRTGLPPQSQLELIAKLDDGSTETTSLVVNYSQKAVPFSPLSLDFADFAHAGAVNRKGAIVDGYWQITPSGIRTVEIGYDRLIAVGDMNWPSGVEVLVTATLHSWNPYAGVGLATGWQGHEGNADPKLDWPVEAIGWVRNTSTAPTIQILTFENGFYPGPNINVPGNTNYSFRMRSDDAGGGNRTVRIKIWPSTQAEPGWQLSQTVPGRPGSVLLIAHHADITWKTVSVRPI